MFPLSLLLILQASASLLCDSQLCPEPSVLPRQRGDKKCDLDCYTQVCDFDRQAGAFGQPSDCPNSCRFSENCKAEMLGNGVCDEDCNQKECGWDLGDCGACAKGCLASMLGDGTCDPPCNVAECVFDHYDCGLCKEDCTVEMMGNKVCDWECWYPECQYDMGDCDTKGECLASMIGDKHCDAACDVDQYNFDDGDCICSPGCDLSYVSDTTCQLACNVTECSFDGGYCLTCAEGCTWELQNNKACDAQCDVPECEYDNGSCSCAAGCTKGDIGKCKPECLVIGCSYDQYNQPNGCSDSFALQFAQYVGITAKSFAVPVQPSQCSGTCSYDMLKEAYSEGVCQSGCAHAKCAYALGLCAEMLPEDCSIGWGPSNGQCFKCDTFQYFGTCLNACPRGLVAYSPELRLCIPGKDTSSLNNPDIMQVSEDKNAKAFNTDDLYYNIMDAFAAAWAKFTVIKLIGKTINLNFKYMYSHLDNVEYSRHPLFPDVISDGTWEYLRIQSLPCSESPSQECFQGTTTLQIYPKAIGKLENKVLVFQNVVLTTRQLFAYSKYPYCPSLTKTSDGYYDDKGQYVDEIRSDYFQCKDYTDISLFLIGFEGEIRLQDVIIRDVNIQLKALIELAGGSATFSNVTFSSVQPAMSSSSQAVILGTTQCDPFTTCGSFSYQRGRVEYLNNGYELQSTVLFNPFIQAAFLGKVLIEDVVFQYNLIWTMSRNLGLITIGSFQSFNITKCTVDSSILLVRFLDLRPAVVLTPQQQADPKLFFSPQIVISQVNITKTMAGYDLIYIVFSESLLNIVISDCTFSQIGMIASGLIYIEYEGDISREMITGGVNRETGTAIYPNYITLAHISFTNILGFERIITLNKLVNIELSDLTFRRNGKIAGMSMTTIAAFYVGRPDIYAEITPANITASDCVGMVLIENSVNSNVRNLMISGNKCEIGGTNLAYTSSPGIHLVSNFTLSDNIGGGDHAIGLYLITQVAVSVSNFQAKSNSAMVRGVIFMNFATSLSLSDSLLQDNACYSGAGIYGISVTNLTITNTVFRRNTASLSEGGAIYFTPFFNPSGILVVRSCTFEANSANSGGAIAISLYTGGEAFVFSITNTNFAYNKATTVGSSLTTSSTVVLKTGATVQGCTFVHETSSSGVIGLAQLSGLLVISDSVFDDCTGKSIAVLNLQTGNDAVTYVSSVTVKNAKGGSVIRKANSLLFSLLITENCSFLFNSVTVLLFESGYWEDAGSVFRNNINSVVVMKTSAIGKLTSTLFESNVSPAGGGAFRATESSLNCTECVFRNNTALYGGALAYEQSTTVNLLSCLFEANKATDYAAAIAVQGTISTPTYIGKTVFRRNSSQNGLIILFSAAMNIDSVLAEYNTAAATGSPGIIAMQSTLVGNNITCRYQTGIDASFMSIQTSSTAAISNSLFYEGSAGNSGAISLSASTLTVTKSSFYALTGTNSAVLSAQGINIIEFDYVTAFDLSSDGEGSVLTATYSFVSVAHSTFRAFEKGAIAGENLLYISISDTTFEQGSSGVAGGVLCRSCLFLNITACVFQSLNATFGGAIELETCSSVTVSNTLFKANEATTGGAIYSKDSQLLISHCNFQANRANETSGGGLYLACPSMQNCDCSISNCVFEGNFAAVSGGALAWKDTQPALINVTTANNSAYYGPNYASFPASLQSSSSRLLQEALPGLPPGQSAGVTISATLVDHYNQKVLVDNSSTANLEATGAGASISGDSKATAINGVFNFSGFSIYAEPQGQVTIRIITNGIPGKSDSNAVSLAASMRSCIAGESTASHSCNPCGSRTYGFDPAKPCQNCHPNAQCLGTTQMYPNSGYWRSGMFSEEVWACLRPASCLGGDPYDNHSISWTGYCAEGYKSNMCQSCAWAFSRSGRDKCGKCPSQEVNTVRIIFVIIAMVAYNVYQVWAALANAAKPTAIHSIYLKILTNYLQLVFLVTEFRLEWPQPVSDLFSAQESSGGVTEQLYSIDCFLSDNEDASKVYFKKMVFLAVLPLCIAVCIIGFWVIVSIKQKTLKYLKRELAASLIIAFSFIHPTLTKAYFAMFSCKEIDQGEQWLTIDLAIRCYDSEHYKYLFAVGIPCIVVWVFAVPLLWLVILIRNRRDLDELWLRLQYGFLISGFTRKRFYWEFVITFRKIAVICCSVFFTDSVDIQALTVQLLLIGFLLLQLVICPYTLKELNSVEFKAILVANVTIYCGLYYLTDALSDASSWFFFVVIVFANAVFIIYWIFGFLGFIVDKLALAVPWIGISLRPQAFERDPYIEAFLAEIPAFKPAYRDFEKVENLNNLFAYFLKNNFVHSTLAGIEQPSYIPSKPLIQESSNED